MPEIFGVTGWKNSGKTTLVAKLVEEMVRRGISVSTVKHAHQSFEIDHEGTDSFRHRQAGALETAIVSDNRWALMHEVPNEGAKPSLENIVKKLAPCKLVLVEGFKQLPFPKIECIRADTRKADPVWKANPAIIAIATDEIDPDCPLPQFELDDVPSIADYIIQKSGLHSG